MKKFGAAGTGVTAADITRAASDEAGADLSSFFARHVEGTEPIPLEALLEEAGITVKSRPVWSRADGRDIENPASVRAWAGLDLQDTTIRSVVPGGPGERGAVMQGDEVIAVQGRRVQSEAALRSALGRIGPGGRATVTVFRGSRLLELEIKLEDNPHRIITLELPEEPGPIARKWLALD